MEIANPGEEVYNAMINLDPAKLLQALRVAFKFLEAKQQKKHTPNETNKDKKTKKSKRKKTSSLASGEENSSAGACDATEERKKKRLVISDFSSPNKVTEAELEHVYLDSLYHRSKEGPVIVYQASNNRRPCYQDADDHVQLVAGVCMHTSSMTIHGARIPEYKENESDMPSSCFYVTDGNNRLSALFGVLSGELPFPELQYHPTNCSSIFLRFFNFIFIFTILFVFEPNWPIKKIFESL